MATRDSRENGFVEALPFDVANAFTAAYRLFVYAVIGFVIAPLLIVVLLSFRPQAYGNRVITEGWPSTTYYESLPELLSSLGFVSSLSQTLTIAITTTVVSTIIGGFAAYAIVRYDFTFSSALETVLISPLVYPWLLMAISILMFISQISETLGVTISLSFSTLLAGHVLFTFPYPIRTIGASLQNYDDELDEAARNLGGTKLDTIRHVTLPLLKPGILSGMAFVFILSFNQYIISLFLSGSDVQTVPLLMFNLIKSHNPPEIAVLGTLLMAGMVLLVATVEHVAGMSEYI